MGAGDGRVKAGSRKAPLFFDKVIVGTHFAISNRCSNTFFNLFNRSRAFPPIRNPSSLIVEGRLSMKVGKKAQGQACPIEKMLVKRHGSRASRRGCNALEKAIETRIRREGKKACREW